ADAVEACSAPSGHVDNDEDCDDGDDDIHPGATEILGDGVDQNCDGGDSSYDELADVAVCPGSADACIKDVDGDGSVETLLMVDDRLNGTPAEAYVYANAPGCWDANVTTADAVDRNAAGYYVVDFRGMSACSSELTLVSTTTMTAWWQNFTFCT